jgi:geranylgeranyl diphosphate synthase type I
MKCTTNKQKNANGNDIVEQVQKLLEERGSKALEEARRTILQEEVECKEVHEALNYFMQEYWRDLARPTLLSLACEAVGGDPEITTPIAVPMILISGAIDIHDDIIDQSKTKWSRPTVLGKFGKDIALLVGDALLFKGFTLLYKAIEKGIPADKVTIIIDIIKKAFFELGDAEALELRFRGRMDVTPEEYLDVIKKKAADVEAHTRISAILGGGSEEKIDALGKYGRILGMLAILNDDLSDMIDFEEAVHRFKRECLPLPILYALQSPKIKIAISSILLKETMTKKDAETVLKIVRRVKGLERMGKLMQKLARDACAYLKDVKCNRTHLKLLIQSTLPPLQIEAESISTMQI